VKKVTGGGMTQTASSSSKIQQLSIQQSDYANGHIQHRTHTGSSGVLSWSAEAAFDLQVVVGKSCLNTAAETFSDDPTPEPWKQACAMCWRRCAEEL
jgi:hypothetical protein